MHEFDVVGQFAEAMANAGIPVNASDIVADGGIHRIHVQGDKNGSKNGWYILHYDQHPAGAFGCNKRLGMERIKWSMKGTVSLTPEERIELRKKARESAEKKRIAEEKRFSDAASRALKVWEASAEATDDHPYLKKKGVRSHGLRVGAFELIHPETGEITVVSKNSLLVPLRDKDKKIWSLQAIFPDSKNVLRRDKNYLQGGRKAGLFCTIGKPIKFGDRIVILICEGYATGASLHEATGHAVVVAFDAGNLPAVAKTIRDAMPKAIIVICADNDLWTERPYKNPGVHWAERAAKDIDGIIAVPPFVYEDGEHSPTKEDPDRWRGPSDFNDLAARDGNDAVAAVIDAALNPAPADTPAVAAKPAEPIDDAPPPAKDDQYDTGGYFAMLGYDHERYYFFQHEKKQVLVYTKGDFTEAGLIALAPLNWWEMEFPKEKGGIDRAIAMDWLMRGCNKAGIYDPKRIRRRGAWSDNKRIVFHHGGYLTVDGVETALTNIRSRYVYELYHSLPDPADTPLSDAEGRRLVEIAKMFRWAKPGSAALLAGWVALAPLCGALRWRPHLWLTGGAGSGKTTVMERFVHPLMNGIEIYAQGNSTEAGIRQELKSDALPVLFDESESNEEKDALRIQNVMSLIRQASTESQAKTLKGTAGGDSLSFHIRSMFCLSSIQVAIKHQADVERVTKLALRPKREDLSFLTTWDTIKDALYWIERDGTLPARLFRRSLSLIPVTLANVETFATAAAEKFGSQRDGDQYGTMLAGCWSLMSQELATPEQAAAMIDNYDWSEHLEGSDEDESSRALAMLLEAHIKLQGGTTLTVYELVRLAMNRIVTGSDMPAAAADAMLQRYGMRIKDGKMLLSNKSDQLKKLMSGTPYEADLRGVLLRYPGADRHGNSTVRIGGIETKCVALPLDFADDEAILPSDQPGRIWQPTDEEPF